MSRLTHWLSSSFSARPSSPARSKLKLEALEGRDVPATFTVTSVLDSGAGSLREAIGFANDETANPGADTIVFDASVFTQPIFLATAGETSVGNSALAITSDITIDGWTNYPGTGIGAVITRDSSVDSLRLFHVSSGATLTLDGVSLGQGRAVGANGGDGATGGGGGAGLGGAIFNNGTLNIRRATLYANAAVGGNGGAGDGNIEGGTGGGPAGGAGGNGFNSYEGEAGSFGSGGGGMGQFGTLGGNAGFGGGSGAGTTPGTPGFSGGTGSTTQGGGGAGLGGAIFNNLGTVNIQNSTIAGNIVTGGNGATALGGAIFNLNGTLTVLNSTISDNTATDGGAIFVVASPADGGVGSASPAAVTLVNSILADSSATNDLGLHLLSGGSALTVTATEPNIIESTSNIDGTFTNTGVITADPQLQSLNENGGPTPTIGIPLTSPAFNAGSNSGAASLTTDQRGIARTDGGTVDIGGLEADATAPTIVSVTPPSNDTYVQGEDLNFTVVFSEPVTVVGTPRIGLTVGSTLLYANYISGSGTTTLTFQGAAQLGDLDTDGIEVISPVELNGGTIRDTIGNNSVLTFTPPNTSAVLVDAVAPTISSVTPPANDTYLASENLTFVLTFSENVTVTGVPQLSLTVGSTPVVAGYVSGSGSNQLTFQYTVASGDTDAEGIEVASPVVLNGGTIQDSAGNSATLTFTPPNTSAVLVDTTAPTITTVTAPTDDTYLTGEHIDFLVTFDELATVTGTPRIAVTIGSTNGFAEYLSGTGTTQWTFRYTVQSGDVDTDGIAVTSPVELNSGTIQDVGGNNATLTFTPPTTTGILVDGTAPAVLSITLAGANPTEADTVEFTVTFSEPVTGVDASDFTAVGSGLSGATVLGVSGSGDTYIVSVSVGTGSGTLQLNLNDSGTGIADLNSTPITGGFTSGEQYTITEPVPPVVVPPQPTTILPTVPVVVLPSTSGASTTIQVFNPATGQNDLNVTPFAGFTGIVSVSMADLSGDGKMDTIVGAGAGGGPRVIVLDGATASMTSSFFAFDSGFTGGVRVAAGDLNGDGIADIVVAAGAGGGPHIRAFSGADRSELLSFFAYDAGFQGGMNVAVADVNGDGTLEIITGTRSGAPNVRVFNGSNGLLVNSFFAFDQTRSTGVSIAAGDLDGNGRAEIITGSGAGFVSEVRLFNGETGTQLNSFQPFDAGFRGGVSVTITDADADGKADIAVGAGPGGAPHLKVFDGETFSLLSSLLIGPISNTGVSL